MHQKPTNEAARNEPEGEPAPASEPATRGGDGPYRIKCTHAVDGTFAGWLDYSGPGNHAFLTGEEGTPGGMTFADYINGGSRYLNPVGTYVGNPRYLGANGNTGDCQADWNYWVRRTAIIWDGKKMIQMKDSPQQHLYDYGGGYVYWGTRMDTALNCERVSA